MAPGARVGLDYHLEIEGFYYSVPHALIRAQVDARITSRIIEVSCSCCRGLRSTNRHIILGMALAAGAAAYAVATAPFVPKSLLRCMLPILSALPVIFWLWARATFGDDFMLKRDQAAIENAQTQVDYTTIKAPLSGRAGFRTVDPGKLASRDEPVWTEGKWPVPIDQWGEGWAFACDGVDCGTNVSLYLRPKIGFCNCQTRGIPPSYRRKLVTARIGRAAYRGGA